MKKLTRLCIVRHGETDWNTEKRIQGHLDIPLNEAGLSQSHATADGLGNSVFRAVFSSDLRRSWQTAEIVARRLAIPLYPEPGLRERHSGVLEGRTIDEIAQSHPVAHERYLNRDPDYAFGVGESMRVFAARVVSAVGNLIACHPGESLLIVTHGGVLDVIYRIATGRGLDSPRDYPMPNAGINWFEHCDQTWRMVAWAEQFHLDPAVDSGSDHPE